MIKRKTFYVSALVLLPVIFLELASYVMLFALFDGPARVRESRESLVSVDTTQAGLISAGRTKQFQYILHPYMGFVYDATYNAAVGPYGFVGDDIVAEVADGNYNVVVTGGSVAGNFYVMEFYELKKRLQAIPALAGKKINMACIATAGYKQPQQLLSVAYLLSLGARIDLLVNIDGFNEMVIPLTENQPEGISVFYPTMWKDLTDDLGDSRQRILIGELSLVDAARTTLAKWFSWPGIDWSMTANLTWFLLDNVLSGQAREKVNELERTSGALKVFQKGPPDRGDRDAVQERLADAWGTSSRLLGELAKSGEFAYVHVLQPNQYVPGSKPLSENEKKIAISPTPGMAETTAQGYERLAQRIADIEQAQIPFLDATMIFQNVTEDVYFDTCCHFNKLGNDILLDAIMGFLGKTVYSPKKAD
ncbi:hypothetical protein G3N56_08635 [Desulfovibrio sulfodismutans]|uniref:SGNH/GDSL hydrolase family protein n=1 Tax=Desulfolutivibrio sulfodismutans TaxID=63561 RepID=A0A7K3NKS8_9BACT|nr:hypothetical protein [Desulfolutivibrio sulfodismutans]NDY56808.1 hypothetical protein [Desulfolutivibrio sulfodismutans]QLA10947.1 hypothetical protein GD606_00955 [Desulfolutivibrio sulfodismutans DSM 3696]